MHEPLLVPRQFFFFLPLLTVRFIFTAGYRLYAAMLHVSPRGPYAGTIKEDAVVYSFTLFQARESKGESPMRF